MNCVFLFIAVATAALVGSPTSASPLSDWDKLDQLFGPQELCEAYPHGEVLHYERETCSFSCERWRYQARLSCSGDQAEILWVKDRDGSVFSRSVIQQEQWLEAGGNPLRLYAAVTESYGQIFTLESLVETTEGRFLAQYSVHSPLPSGGLRLIGEGHWEILQGPQPATARILVKEHINHALFNEKSRDRLLNAP